MERINYSVVDFLDMGYNEEDSERLCTLQEHLFIGAKVGLIINHHTDEFLLGSINRNGLDSNNLTVSRIDWSEGIGGMIFFEHANGWAGPAEISF